MIILISQKKIGKPNPSDIKGSISENLVLKILFFIPTYTDKNS